MILGLKSIFDDLLMLDMSFMLINLPVERVFKLLKVLFLEKILGYNMIAFKEMVEIQAS